MCELLRQEPELAVSDYQFLLRHPHFKFFIPKTTPSARKRPLREDVARPGGGGSASSNASSPSSSLRDGTGVLPTTQLSRESAASKRRKMSEDNMRADQQLPTNTEEEEEDAEADHSGTPKPDLPYVSLAAHHDHSDSAIPTGIEAPELTLQSGGHDQARGSEDDGDGDGAGGEHEFDLELELERLLQSSMSSDLSSSGAAEDLHFNSPLTLPETLIAESDHRHFLGHTTLTEPFSRASLPELPCFEDLTRTTPSPSPSSSSSSASSVVDSASGSLISSSQPLPLPLPLSLLQHPPQAPAILPTFVHTPTSSFSAGAPIPVPPSLYLQPPVATVTLLHKPRGSHGVWMSLSPDQRIRVTKGKGKRLRVEVACNRRFVWSEMMLHLMDITEGGMRPCQDFVVCTSRSTLKDDGSGGTTAVVEVNVVRVIARLQFLIAITSRREGWIWRGSTGPFITHNNGKDRSPRRGRGKKPPPGGAGGSGSSNSASASSPSQASS